jgi:glycosyltransferase involved in cell wall biosynthesis
VKEKISILLPLYNDELYIKKAIQSVFANSYKNFELVVINDGSNDNSLEIVKSINDERLKIYTKSNTGLIDTLNYGLTKCNYEIIMRMDGDDEIEKEKIETQLLFFKKLNPIILGTGGYIINNFSEIKSKVDVPENNKSILKKMRLLQPSIIHASIMFYKDAIIKAGKYDEKFSVAEDYELFYRLSRMGDLRNINIPFYKIRKNEENVSVTRSRTQLLNTMIARRLYQDQNLKKVNINDYNHYIETTENSMEFKIIDFLNNKINNSKSGLLKNLCKVLRKIITITLK